LNSVDLKSDLLIDEMLEDPLLAAGGNETFINPDTTFNSDKCSLGELLRISGLTCIRFEQLCDSTRDCVDDLTVRMKPTVANLPTLNNSNLTVADE
jgi:hypothetical protein